jgi:hypothetical protein
MITLQNPLPMRIGTPCDDCPGYPYLGVVGGLLTVDRLILDYPHVRTL